MVNTKIEVLHNLSASNVLLIAKTGAEQYAQNEH